MSGTAVQQGMFPSDIEKILGDPPQTIEDGLAEARRIIEFAALKEGPPVRTFLLLSGGNDSMVLFDACAGMSDEVVHINTGIGIPETTDFVRWVVPEAGRSLTELTPPIPYEDLVLGPWEGLPGPGAHQFTYTMLKERCIEQLTRNNRTRRGQRFALLAGARTAESTRRMGTADPWRRKGGQVWINPLLRWSNALMREYRVARGLPINPVTEHLHMSGECLCGAYASPGELDHVGFFYPAFKERIQKLEAVARKRQLPYCKWGKERPKPQIPGQLAFAPMCTSCESRDETGVEIRPPSPEPPQ